MDRETFVTLARIASCNVLMLTHDGYVRQKDGLAMGSPPAPHLANGWLSKHDNTIKGDAKIFTRYMDDVLRNAKVNQIEQKLQELNSLHPNLKFTIEREVDGALPFLDMKIMRSEQGTLSSTWYNKPTDTGLIMNFHALAPKRYKRSVVSGFVYRIHRACSSWTLFHESLEKAKQVLERNQYPPEFYGPIIHDTLTKIISPPQPDTDTETSTNTQNAIRKKLIMIQYRGKSTEEFAKDLHGIKAPCTVVMTLRKLKTVLSWV